MIMLEVKFESDTNRIVNEIVDCRNVDTASVQETWDKARGTYWRQMSDEMSTVIVTRGWRYPKWRNVGQPLNFIGPLRDFHNLESAVDKLLETDLNLEGNRTICQGIENMLIS